VVWGVGGKWNKWRVGGERAGERLVRLGGYGEGFLSGGARRWGVREG